MSLLRRSFIALSITSAIVAAGFTRVAATPQATQSAAASAGEAVYRDTCASCHEAGVPRAVNRAALSRMSADNIRFALTQGAMTTQAANLTPAQIDSVVRFLASPDTAAAATVNRCAP